MATHDLPLYRCHKLVRAIQIHTIAHRVSEDGETHYYIYPRDVPSVGPFPVSAEYMDKHKPQCGGYYVVYEDGYESFSPADAFENGYTRIEE